jgi:hypothetical protein
LVPPRRVSVDSRDVEASEKGEAGDEKRRQGKET